eukprot:TRINITY_DN22860_c0_g1_i1.p1 TRINITY_DN22860_c0_g1~~TRINITY_DN22860_c0_g1_i1.p1  ORF type:complete len:319 (-),score=41.79 TRINITY_DN22860_c0_g1_i1:39-995(-)
MDPSYLVRPRRVPSAGLALGLLNYQYDDIWTSHWILGEDSSSSGTTTPATSETGGQIETSDSEYSREQADNLGWTSLDEPATLQTFENNDVFGEAPPVDVPSPVSCSEAHMPVVCLLPPVLLIAPRCPEVIDQKCLNLSSLKYDLAELVGEYSPVKTARSSLTCRFLHSSSADEDADQRLAQPAQHCTVKVAPSPCPYNIISFTSHTLQDVRKLGCRIISVWSYRDAFGFQEPLRHRPLQNHHFPTELLDVAAQTRGPAENLKQLLSRIKANLFPDFYACFASSDSRQCLSRAFEELQLHVVCSLGGPIQIEQIALDI